MSKQTPSMLKNKILNLLFPPKCVFCGQILSSNGVCSCEKSIDKLAMPNGALAFSAEDEIKKYISPVWACYQYSNAIKKAIHRFKFQDEPELNIHFANILYQKWMQEGLMNQFDYLVPVPVSRQRKNDRGYAQTHLVAKELSILTGVPVATDILIKVKNTEKQSHLKRKQRLTNLIDAFEVENKEKIQNKRICIVDDIVTTGSTLKECGKTLLNANALSCSAICIACSLSKYNK